ncbi:hypothetical protein AYI70_g4413 [Smittium culicis]|uniref:Uncharacterized protein n=1 Tax=Smittium culicis TaxID=133412 RepID=A0A1R1X579_9FUNG|nr:hypothetical protein AYI70_g10718 [Smittium culicis]OMJ19949.1 hypothetical protein AYI70_g4413 [Smittium culicis]
MVIPKINLLFCIIAISKSVFVISAATNGDFNIIIENFLEKKYPVKWVSATKDSIPSNAIIGGVNPNGDKIYIARKRYLKSLIPGAASNSSSGSFFSGLADNKNIISSSCEILTGDPNGIKWVSQKGVMDRTNFYPIPAGFDDRGLPLYIGQSVIDGQVCINPASDYLPGGLSCINKNEIVVPDTYNVLIFSS